MIATGKAEIRRIMVQAQPGQNDHKTLFSTEKKWDW
jgi:hypothetical protein